MAFRPLAAQGVLSEAGEPTAASDQHMEGEEDAELETKPSVVSTALDFVNDVYACWRPRALEFLWRPNVKAAVCERMKAAKTYTDWHDAALELDHLEGNDTWRSDPVSPYYDYKLISSLVSKLGQLRYENRLEELAEVVRSGLIRNMGSIAASELYTFSYAGTKFLIDSYITNVCESLVTLSRSLDAHSGPPYSLEASEERALLKTYFRNCRQSYGRTALILQGGSLFGLCHLGVIKGLLDAELLPSVICGATVGAIVAAYVCSVPYEELGDAIKRVPLEILSYTGNIRGTGIYDEGDDASSVSSSLDSDKVDASSLDYAQESKQDKRPPGSSTSGGFAGSGLPYYGLYTKEILVFLEFALDQLGDLTFEEAYIKSGRILNILVLPAGSSSSTFYNYLVTPKVIVRSAVLASIGSGMLPGNPEVNLIVKDYEGKVQPHPDSPQTFWPANHKTYVPTRESPYTRLAELFNVNNYVVSISRPYYAPLLLTEFRYRGQPRLWLKLVSLIRLSMQYRIGQLSDWGLLSPRLKALLIDEMIPGGFQVNVVPDTGSLIHDLMLIFDSTNIRAKVKHWMELGERSVWPQMTIISARSKIEYVLEEINEELK